MVPETQPDYDSRTDIFCPAVVFALVHAPLVLSPFLTYHLPQRGRFTPAKPLLNHLIFPRIAVPAMVLLEPGTGREDLEIPDEVGK
jgi:hypothetical protein